VLAPEWQDFLSGAWPSLVRRGRLCVPPGLPHPSAAGFERPWLAEPAGQVADWTYSLSDGSRLHAHEYEDGGIVVHRDALDPNQGLVRAAGHVVAETSLGRVGFLLLAGYGFAVLLSRLSFAFSRVPVGATLRAVTG
jgi:hypothetical protein